jgi:L-alanine-DL-glutamate epimerase-like enolase superfamily enzyme
MAKIKKTTFILDIPTIQNHKLSMTSMAMFNDCMHGNFIVKPAIETALLNLKGKQLGVPISMLHAAY